MTQIDQDVLFTILNGLGIPVPQFFKEDGTPVKMSGNVAPWFELKDSNIMQQADIQRRYSKTVQSHAGATVANAGFGVSPYIDTLGFNEVGICVKNDAAKPFTVNLSWSNDGVATQGRQDNVITTTTQADGSISVPTRARWVSISIANTDTVPHTFNGWAYLKV